MEGLKEKVICSMCKEPFGGVPKVLPGCLHVFCTPCLQKLPISYAVEETKGTNAEIVNTSSSKMSFKESYFGDSCTSSRSADSALTESLQDSASVSMSMSSKPSLLQRSNSVLERSKLQQRMPRQESEVLSFSISCPKCDRITSLPTSGVAGLRTDYLTMSLVGTYKALLSLQSKLTKPTCDQCVKDVPAVSFCANCVKLICEDHSKCHNLWEEFKNHKVFPLSALLGKENDLKLEDDSIVRHFRPSFHVGEFCCPQHLKERADHQIKYFCTSCSDLMCGNCAISTHKLSEHNCDFITREYLAGKKQLTEESLVCLTSLFKDLDLLAQEISNKTKKISQRGVEVKNKVNELFSEVVTLLEARKKKLCEEIDDINKDALARLSSCTEKVRTLKDHVRDCQNFVQGNLDCEGGLSLLTVADVISSHSNSVALDYQKILPEAKVAIPEIIISQQRQNQLTEAISKYGGVHVLPSMTLSQERNLSLPLFLSPQEANSSKGMAKLTQSEVFSRNLLDSITGGHVYSPPLLSPPVCRPDDLSSPIMINLPKIAGIHVRTIEDVPKPSGIRIDHRNSNIIACSFGSHRVITLNQDGMEIQSIGEKGDRNGQFLYPQSTATDSAGKTLVVDSLYRIQLFDRSGKFLKSVGQKGKGQVQFNDPVAIALGPNRKIYVLERHNQRIQVLNSNFSFHSFIGKAGRGECEFYLPNDMTIGVCNHLFVADTGNHRIQILSLEGSFLLTFGLKGNDPGELMHPSHLCVSNDEICVSEEGNHRVSIFNMKGYFMQCFGQKGSGEMELDRPSGIAIDQNKTLYVSDSKNNRIQVFK